MQIRDAAVATHKGSAHEVNEDGVMYLEEVPLLAVVDGLGGKGRGDLASRTAIEAIERRMRDLVQIRELAGADTASTVWLRVGAALEDVIATAHKAVRDAAAAVSASDRAAASIACILLTQRHAFIAHVGDARAYLIRGGRLRTLTEDHTIAMLRYRQGRMTDAEYKSSPLRKRLYQVLGAGDIDVDVAQIELADNDVFLLCTDGVHTTMTSHEIRTLVDSGPLDATARAIVNRSRKNGSRDDASVAVLRVSAAVDSDRMDLISRTLGGVFLFAPLTEAERSLLAPYLDRLRLSPGQVLFEEGDDADSFYVLVDGKVAISKGATHLVDVGPGGQFGELCLARPTVRSATVTATESTLLYRLSRQRFHEIVRRRPSIGARIALAALDYVGERLRDLTERLEKS